MVRVGIPRALLYYQYYPMWRAFFEELGAEIVVSPPTTEEMLVQGTARVVAETCLPVKVFLGHVIHLAGKCDCVFIPAIKSIRKDTINCSKFLGLPDMTRDVIPEAPPVIDVDIDTALGKSSLFRSVYALGRHFTPNPLKIRRAALNAVRTWEDYNSLMRREELNASQAIKKLNGENIPTTGLQRADYTVAFIGHPYLLHDSYINHRLISRLEKAGCRVVTPEIVPEKGLLDGVARLIDTPYWTYEEEVTGAGGYYLQSEVDGVIGIMAFGCGPDSLMMDMVARKAARVSSVPFMSLTIEEHTADAGLVTRLEAFLDMIERRKKKQVLYASRTP